MKKILMTALGVALFSSMTMGQEGKAVLQVAVEPGKISVHDLQADSLKQTQNIKQQIGVKAASDSAQQKGGVRLGADLQNSQDPEAVEYRKKLQKKESPGAQGQAGQVELKNSQDPEAVRERKKQQETEEKGGVKPQEKKPDDPEV